LKPCHEKITGDERKAWLLGKRKALLRDGPQCRQSGAPNVTVLRTAPYASKDR